MAEFNDAQKSRILASLQDIRDRFTERVVNRYWSAPASEDTRRNLLEAIESRIGELREIQSTLRQF